MADDYQILLDAPVTALARVQIAKLGDFTDERYGDFSITADEVKAWQANLAKLPGARAPIDFDHLADKPGGARRTEAAGWITGVELADGVPVADISWTPIGEQAIVEQRYLFFSPSYGPFTDEHGTVTPDVLQGGALTNKPFLNMPTVCLSRNLDVLTGRQRKDLPASDFVFPDTRRYPIPDLAHARDALARAAGKPEQAQVKAAVHKRFPALADKQMQGADSRPSMPTISPKILEALGLAEDADEATQLSAITELKTAPKSLEAQASEQGKVLLDAAEHDRLRADSTKATVLEGRLTAIETERADEKFETAFTAAQHALDATPETRETFRELFDASREATLKTLAALAAAKPIVNTSARGSGGHDIDMGVAPRGTDPEAYELDQRIHAHMAANPGTDYLKALDAVSKER